VAGPNAFSGQPRCAGLSPLVPWPRSSFQRSETINLTTNRIRLATLALAAIATFAAAACAGGGAGEDKAGGSSEPVVLRLANTNGQLDFTPAVVDFVDRVEELSGGDLPSRPWISGGTSPPTPSSRS
jgi:hypothetical protein